MEHPPPFSRKRFSESGKRPQTLTTSGSRVLLQNPLILLFATGGAEGQ